MITDIDEGNRKQLKDKMEEEILPRRALLRGALALGCSLLLPAALFGCDSRKGANSTGSAPPGSPATSAENSAPKGTGKASQASAQYQPEPKGEQKCSGCLHFIPESNTCKLVEGQISPEGWCIVWAKQA